jgi:hypothetical protein
MKLEISESESQRAERRINRFYEKHGGIYYDLAAHAAYPFLNLTSDLVYCLRENFVPQAPWIAISDILLSPLCQNLGGDLYEMDPAVRMMLCQNYWDHDDEVDCRRLEELNDFATQYLNSQINNRLSEYIGDPEKFSWCKLGLRDYHEAAEQLVSKLQDFSKNRKYINFSHWLKFYKIEKNVVDYEFLEKILPLSVRWETSLGKAAIDLDEYGLSEQLRSILPYSEDLSIDLDGNSIIVTSNKFNYMMFKHLVESDEILGETPEILEETPQPINIKRVLIVTSNRSLSRAISRAFDISFESLKNYLKIDWVSELEDAISLLSDKHFDLVITFDNLEHSRGHTIYEGLRLCDYISSNHPDTAKILIVSKLEVDAKDINHSVIDRYKLGGLFVFQNLDLKLLVQKSTSLLEGIETNVTSSPKQQPLAASPTKQGGRFLGKILEQQKKKISDQLESLDQTIIQFEIEEILTDYPPSRFELNQKIADLKKRKNSLEQEIEELVNRLYQARENSN